MADKPLAIHHRSGSYSDRWIEYCIEHQVKFKIVDCNQNNILKQLEGCSGLMWHWDLTDFRSYVFARQLSFSLIQKGIKLFPDISTSWHYDDKVGQKYLLEAIKAPLVQSYVFYSKKEAIKWAKNTSFPKVFKLRGGAGSSNVKLTANTRKAKTIIRKAFGRGFPYKSRIDRLKQQVWTFRRDKNIAAFKKLIRGVARFFIPKKTSRYYPRQKGYVYFQDYIPDNTYDTRIVIIGNRCFGARRYCRTGDFRASGSGIFTYNPTLINPKMIEIAFDVAEKLNTQSLAFDFVIDGNEPKIIEISYCFAIECCDDAPGYWDKKLRWHPEKVNLQKYIIHDFIDSLNGYSTSSKRKVKKERAIDE